MSSDFYISAFHPKALNVVDWPGRSSGLWQFSNPSHTANGETVVFFESSSIHLLADWNITYSYGDSAGLTPVFPFSSRPFMRREPNPCKFRKGICLHNICLATQKNEARFAICWVAITLVWQGHWSLHLPVLSAHPILINLKICSFAYDTGTRLYSHNTRCRLDIV